MEPKIPDLIRDIYRRLREAMGIEQAELARALGVSVSKVSKWEQGKGSLTPEQVERMGRELRMHAEEHARKYNDAALSVLTKELFKQIRLDHGMSQTEIANDAGLLQFTITMFETGHKALKPHEEDALVGAIKRVIQKREREIKLYQEFAKRLELAAAESLLLVKAKEQLEQDTKNCPAAKKQLARAGH